MNKISILIISLFFGLQSATFAQDNKKVSIEAGINMGYAPDYGNYGAKYYNRINYSFRKHLGFSTSLGYFQSLTSSTSNYSSLLWDADLDLKIGNPDNDKALILSGGLTYFRGALSYESSSRIVNGQIVQSVWETDRFNNFGFNGKCRYQFPLSSKLYSAINADIYFIESFSFADLISVGYSIGYKF